MLSFLPKTHIKFNHQSCSVHKKIIEWNGKPEAAPSEQATTGKKCIEHWNVIRSWIRKGKRIHSAAQNVINHRSGGACTIFSFYPPLFGSFAASSAMYSTVPIWQVLVKLHISDAVTVSGSLFMLVSKYLCALFVSHPQVYLNIIYTSWWLLFFGGVHARHQRQCV